MEFNVVLSFSSRIFPSSQFMISIIHLSFCSILQQMVNGENVAVLGNRFEMVYDLVNNVLRG